MERKRSWAPGKRMGKGSCNDCDHLEAGGLTRSDPRIVQEERINRCPGRLDRSLEKLLLAVVVQSEMQSDPCLPERRGGRDVFLNMGKWISFEVLHPSHVSPRD